MSKDIIWVAMRDGSGWSSSRTRDNVDVAFTINKQGGLGNITVTVRQPNRDDDPDSRATRGIGFFYFDTVDEAKTAIIDALEHGNSSTDKQDARDKMCTRLLLNSMLHEGAGAFIGGKFIYQKDLMPSPIYVDPSTVTPIEPVVTTIANTANPITKAEAAFEGWMEMVNSLSENFDPDKTETTTPIMETVEAVQEVTQSVFNPELWQPGEDYPSGYMEIGGRLMKMEWPK